MGNTEKPERILFLLTPKTREPFILHGVDRNDPGTNLTSSVNTFYMNDDKGSYIPCMAGGYHVHRGKDAEAEYKRCNCPHSRLSWINKKYGAMFCVECHHTFVVDQETEDRDVVCCVENGGVVEVFYPDEDSPIRFDGPPLQ